MASTGFGLCARQEHFQFDPAYRPLNHGSYGAFPRIVRSRQLEIQHLTEARSDPFIRFQAPQLLLESRQAVSELLGVDYKELVFVPNATTGINTVLRNLTYTDGDVILYFNTAYRACEKTILHVCETTPAEPVRIDVLFPLEDDQLLATFNSEINGLKDEGKRVRIAMFDTVCTFPGVQLPWEALIAACRELDVLSLVDGAHGVGHIALEHLGRTRPDFFTSNCYKWLFTPRPCAILYVPSTNHHLIRTTFPTSHGFSPLQDSANTSSSSNDYLGDLFAWAATVDMSPYLCVTTALKFRRETCGGESVIREYCFDLARRGGARMAEVLGTEVLDNKAHSLSRCCFAMVRLPLTFSADCADDSTKSLSAKDGPAIVKAIMHTLMNEYSTWIPGKFYAGAAWMRISAQIYLEMDDFEWAAGVLKQICEDLQPPVCRDN